MGIHGLSKVIGDHAPSGSKENEIKNYFGKWFGTIIDQMKAEAYVEVAATFYAFI